MSIALTSDSLVESIKRRASIPENQSTFSKQDFLDFANEELQLGVVPAIMSLHEDYLLFEEDKPLESNESEYEIPSRAMGNKLRDVQFKIDAKNFIEMTRIGIGERFSEFDVRTETNLKKYYVKNNKIVLVPPVGPNPSTSQAITMVFYIRPSKLVLEERIGVITGINRTSGEITFSTIPDHFNTNIQYDFYKAGSPHTILNIDKTATNVNSTTNSITFAVDDIPKNLQVGDHIGQAGECIIPQIPSELHVMLTQMVACRVLESIGDTQGLQNALVKLKQMEEAAGMIIDNRVDDAPQKAVNRHGLVRTSIFSKRFNRR